MYNVFVVLSIVGCARGGYDRAMRVAVIGTGYVGLVTGVCFAEIGNDVTCVDIDEAKVVMLQRSEAPIYEPGIEELLRQNSERQRLHFTTDLRQVGDAEVIFLALPTPPNADGSADLRAVLAVAERLPEVIGDHFTVVVNKSTVPVGTAAQVRTLLAACGDHVAVVSNPEFLREGLAIHDFMEPDRVVVGASDERAESVMRELYAPLIDDSRPLLVMDEASAELTKYAANAFLATKISFINEIANVAEHVGANVEAVARAMGADERIGSRFLQAGIGYGGSCFPKDVQALARIAETAGYDFQIIRAVLAANSAQQVRLVEKVLDHFGGDIAGKTFALWGLAFKPDTDDIREAPSLKIIDALTAAGATVQAFDPEAAANVSRYFQGRELPLTYAETAIEALAGADALLVATEWKAFRAIDPKMLVQHLTNPLVFDGRNIFMPQAMRQCGITYYSIGRP